MISSVPDLHLTSDTQCLPFYVYDEDGTNMRVNITDRALAQFQAKYGPDVTKQDIFHYVYGLLHSPQYRERYKENLKRELPRIPLVGGEEAPETSPLVRSAHRASPKGEIRTTNVRPPLRISPLGETPRSREERSSEVPSPFQTFVAVGARLAALHVGYEQAEEYPLTQIINRDVPFTWRVTKMRLSKDKTSLAVNEALTFGGIPPEAFAYRLGNRSALEWVVDQYQVSTDKRSGITSDPNRADDPEYIARLVRKVVTVSVETVKLVAGLPLVVSESVG